MHSDSITTRTRAPGGAAAEVVVTQAGRLGLAGTQRSAAAEPVFLVPSEQAR
jgi:hypothetical protein